LNMGIENFLKNLILLNVFGKWCVVEVNSWN